MALQIIQYKDWGAGYAVEFYDSLRGSYFKLNKESLEIRIANRERDNLDTSVERAALAFIDNHLAQVKPDETAS